MFGKSAFILCMVKHATKAVYLSVCVDCENLAICPTKCKNRLVRLKNTLRKLTKLSKKSEEIFTVMHHYGSRDWRKIPVSCTAEAKRGLNFGYSRSTVSLHHLRNYEITNDTNVFANPGIF